MTEHVQNVSTKEFDEVVRQSDIPVIVDIWAKWCGPCRMIAPLVDKFARQFAGKVKFVKVNKDENPEIAEEFGVNSIPRLLVFSGGEKVTEQIGMPDYPHLREWIEEQVIALRQSIEDTPETAAAETVFEDAIAAAFSAYEKATKPAGDIFGKAIKPIQDEFKAYREQLEADKVEGDELAAKLKEKGAELNKRAEPAIAEYKKVSEPAEKELVASMNEAVEAFFAGSATAQDTTGGDTSESTSGRTCPIDDPTCRS